MLLLTSHFLLLIHHLITILLFFSLQHPSPFTCIYKPSPPAVCNQPLLLDPIICGSLPLTGCYPESLDAISEELLLLVTCSRRQRSVSHLYRPLPSAIASWNARRNQTLITHAAINEQP